MSLFYNTFFTVKYSRHFVWVFPLKIEYNFLWENSLLKLVRKMKSFLSHLNFIILGIATVFKSLPLITDDPHYFLIFIFSRTTIQTQLCLVMFIGFIAYNHAYKPSLMAHTERLETLGNKHYHASGNTGSNNFDYMSIRLLLFLQVGGPLDPTNPTIGNSGLSRSTNTTKNWIIRYGMPVNRICCKLRTLTLQTQVSWLKRQITFVTTLHSKNH